MKPKKIGIMPFEGRTIDGRKLRIIVAEVDPNLMVVTAIDLDAGD